MKRFSAWMERVLSWMDDNTVIMAMRHGLVLAIPVLLLGSFSIVLNSLPVPAYQSFLESNAVGTVCRELLLWLYNATMGSLSLVLLATISFSYSRQSDAEHTGLYMVTALSCYVLFTTRRGETPSFEIFDSSWLFSALLITLVSCAVLHRFLVLMERYSSKRYREGTDLAFQNTIISIPPVIFTVLLMVLIKLLCTLVFGGTDIQNFGSDLFMRLFEKIGCGFGGSVLFIILIHFLWFFGIHGSNMLGNVSAKLFEGGMLANMALVAAGQAPQYIFSKTFFDCFILMGGSGATVCLLLALLFVSNRQSNSQNSRKILRISAIPALFNINELVLFGLPVVFNPIMLIPFILVPLVLLGTSTLAMVTGLVPLAAQQVSWTTPIVFSGVLSTGSWRGGALQVVNLVIGVLIYLPFLRISEKYHISMMKNNVQQLIEMVQDGEKKGITTNLKQGGSRTREVAKMLTADLRHAVEKNRIELFYQPQVCSDGTVYGAEALLRWEHPVLGFVYPPLVIELAREDGLLDRLGLQLIDQACQTLVRLDRETKQPFRLSVNISPAQLENPDFSTQVKKILGKYDFGKSVLCFEVTEQIALSSTTVIVRRINELREAGVPFIMDDFGMGHSSMLYLQDNEFTSVKLDGSLVRQMLGNQRAMNIIGGIRQLSDSLGCNVIAEFVETPEQRTCLEQLGCVIYQGYLYGRAMELSDFENFLDHFHALRQGTCTQEDKARP